MRSVLTLLASTVVAAAAVVAGASPASATARHIGVVVRYANGHVSAGCTTVGGSGLQVLERKHTVTMGTQQYSGFVLKIDGTGTTRPDNTHYWSYWHSSGHGGWTYASSGAGSYTPKAGTVEGWSYVNGQSTRAEAEVVHLRRRCADISTRRRHRRPPRRRHTASTRTVAAPTDAQRSPADARLRSRRRTVRSRPATRSRTPTSHRRHPRAGTRPPPRDAPSATATRVAEPIAHATRVGHDGTDRGTPIRRPPRRARSRNRPTRRHRPRCPRSVHSPSSPRSASPRGSSPARRAG